jgi:hypothetical protein
VGFGQAGASKMLDEATTRIPMRDTYRECCTEPLDGLSPEFNMRQTTQGAVGGGLVQGQHAARPDEASGRAEEGHGILLMNQHIPPNHEVEELGRREAVKRGASEGDLLVPQVTCALASESQDFGIAVDADHGASLPYQLPDQQRNISGTAADIQNPHATFDTRPSHQPLGGLSDYRGLLDQPSDLEW